MGIFRSLTKYLNFCASGKKDAEKADHQAHQTIALFGPPLSGKGTHASYLVEEHGYVPIATGTLLRAAATEDSDTGRLIRSYIDRGQLAPEGVVIKVIEDAVAKLSHDTKILFDGSPRREDEYHHIQDILKRQRKAPISSVVSLNVPDDVLFKRMKHRRQSAIDNGETPRTDDQEHILKDRIQIFEGEKQALVKVFKATSDIELIDIDGDRSLDDVKADVLASLDLSSNDSLSMTPAA